MGVIPSIGKILIPEEVSEGTWDLSTAALEGNYQFSVYTTHLRFKSDGLKIIISIGTFLYQYSLSTPWDIETVNYDDISYDTGSSFDGLYINPSGTFLFKMSNATDYVYQYSLSTPWDLSTISYVGYYDVTQSSTTREVWFKPDGTKMYVLSGSYIYQYSLSTPWDLSTVNYEKSKITGGDGYHRSCYFSLDGSKIILGKTTYGLIEKYELSTPWDIASLSNPSNYYDLGESMYCLEFKPDGRKMYVFYSQSVKQFILD